MHTTSRVHNIIMLSSIPRKQCTTLKCHLCYSSTIPTWTLNTKFIWGSYNLPPIKQLQIITQHTNHTHIIETNSKCPNIAGTSKTWENWASHIVLLGGQHLVARRCIEENPEMGSGGMSRLAGLQHRQAASGNFQKRDKIQHNSKIHSPFIQNSTKSYKWHTTHKIKLP